MSIETNQWNEDDDINFSHAKARRLPAEVLYDTIHAVTGASSNFPGVPKGTRAASLPDAGVKLPDSFLANFGRPVRESSCECERNSDMQLGPVMALLSGPTVGNAIADPNNAIAKLVKETKDNRPLIENVFYRILNRPPSEEEIKARCNLQTGIDQDHATLEAALADHLPAIHLSATEQADDIAPPAQISPNMSSQSNPPAMPRKKRQDKIAALDKKRSLRPISHGQDCPVGSKFPQMAALDRTATARLEVDKRSHSHRCARPIDFCFGNNGKTDYTLLANTNLKITAVRLEMLTDDRLPGKGRGVGVILFSASSNSGIRSPHQVPRFPLLPLERPSVRKTMRSPKPSTANPADPMRVGHLSASGKKPNRHL